MPGDLAEPGQPILKGNLRLFQIAVPDENGNATCLVCELLP